jgi:hypothetical protein
MLTPKQAAQRLDVSVSLIYSFVGKPSSATIAWGGVGRRRRIVIDEKGFANYQASCCKEAAQAPLRSKPYGSARDFPKLGNALRRTPRTNP